MVRLVVYLHLLEIQMHVLVGFKNVRRLVEQVVEVLRHQQRCTLVLLA